MSNKFYITLKGFRTPEGIVPYTTSETVFLAETPDDGNPRRMVSMDFLEAEIFDTHEEIWERMDERKLERSIPNCQVWQLSEKELFLVKLSGGVGAPHER